MKRMAALLAVLAACQVDPGPEQTTTTSTTATTATCGDNDGDGFAADICGGDDCCDLDPDVNPGAAAFDVPSDACGPSWDYDCDGVLTPVPAATGDCVYNPATDSCSLTEAWANPPYAINGIADCGTMRQWIVGCTLVPGVGCDQQRTPVAVPCR